MFSNNEGKWEIYMQNDFIKNTPDNIIKKAQL